MMMTTDMHCEPLMTVDDLAQLLRVNRRTIYRMLEAKELPFALKVVGSWRFRPDDVNAWLETKKVQ